MECLFTPLTHGRYCVTDGTVDMLNGTTKSVWNICLGDSNLISILFSIFYRDRIGGASFVCGCGVIFCDSQCPVLSRNSTSD